MKRHLRSLSAKLAFIGIVFSPTVFAEIHLSDLPAAEGRRESALDLTSCCPLFLHHPTRKMPEAVSIWR